MFLKFKLLPSNAAVTNTVEFVFHRDVILYYFYIWKYNFAQALSSPVQLSMRQGPKYNLAFCHPRRSVIIWDCAISSSKTLKM